jgi:hypothetical protein
MWSQKNNNLENIIPWLCLGKEELLNLPLDNLITLEEKKLKYEINSVTKNIK